MWGNKHGEFAFNCHSLSFTSYTNHVAKDSLKARDEKTTLSLSARHLQDGWELKNHTADNNTSLSAITSAVFQTTCNCMPNYDQEIFFFFSIFDFLSNGYSKEIF